MCEYGFICHVKICICEIQCVKCSCIITVVFWTSARKAQRHPICDCISECIYLFEINKIVCKIISVMALLFVRWFLLTIHTFFSHLLYILAAACASLHLPHPLVERVYAWMTAERILWLVEHSEQSNDTDMIVCLWVLSALFFSAVYSAFYVQKPSHSQNVNFIHVDGFCIITLVVWKKSQ